MPQEHNGVPALIQMVRAGSQIVQLFSGRDLRSKEEKEAEGFKKRNAEKAAVSLSKMAVHRQYQLVIADTDGAIALIDQPAIVTSALLCRSRAVERRSGLPGNANLSR